MVAPKVGGLVQPVAKQAAKFSPVEGFAGFRTEGRRPIPAEYKDLAALAALIEPRGQREFVASAPPRALASLRDFGSTGFED